MTIDQIQSALRPHKPVSRDTLYSYLRRFKIKPVCKVRVRPQIYPDDTPARIIRALGLPLTKSKRRQRAA